MSAQPKNGNFTQLKIAIVGGNGRANINTHGHDVRFYASRRDGGNGDHHRLVESIAQKSFDLVIVLARFIGHTMCRSVVDACKTHCVSFEVTHRGASSIGRRLRDLSPAKPPAPVAKHGVVLVDLYWTRDKDPRVPLGHASILTALREARVPTIPVALPINAAGPTASEFASSLIDLAHRLEEPLIAIGAYVWAEEFIQTLLPELRRQGFAGKLVLGGPQVSYAVSGLEGTYPDVDLFVRGYGEQAMVLLAQGEISAGVHRRGEQDKNEQAKVKLTDLPSPWADGTVPLDGQRFVRWETQRGCPYRCGFCQHREAGSRLEWRDLDLARLQQEIELFVRAGVEQIAVLDPIFNIGEHATAVLDTFIRWGYSGELSLQCRAEKLTEEFLHRASQLHVKLEFGLQTIHKNESKAVKRANNIAKVDAGLAQVRSLGLNHEVSLIFGLPEQTLESFRESVRWCLEREVPVIKAFPLLLLRGTALDRERETWGLQVAEGPMAMVTASNTFSYEDWVQMACISEALKQTEDGHPTMLELELLAARLRPDVTRWVAASTSSSRSSI